jgi:hypothetical protein
VRSVLGGLKTGSCSVLSPIFKAEEVFRTDVSNAFYSSSAALIALNDSFFRWAKRASSWRGSFCSYEKSLFYDSSLISLLPILPAPSYGNSASN